MQIVYFGTTFNNNEPPFVFITADTLESLSLKKKTQVVDFTNFSQLLTKFRDTSLFARQSMRRSLTTFSLSKLHRWSLLIL